MLELMRYGGCVDSKTVRNILKEVFPELASSCASLIANVQGRENKMMVAMERDKYGNLNNNPIFSAEDADTLMQ